MKQEFTTVEIEKLMQQLSDVFDRVKLHPIADATEAHSLENEGVSVEYLLDRQPSSCVLTRKVVVNGEHLALRMESHLTSQSCAAHTMSAREQQIYNDDLIRDFLSGAYNRRYWENVFCSRIPSLAAQGQVVAVAIVSIDHFEILEQTHGALDTDQLICNVANQWKKFYDEGADKVVCRLSKYTFAVGCVGAEETDLENQMRCLYEKMNLVCTSTCGMLCKIPYTLSVACASTVEVCNPTWAELQILCEARLNSLGHTGGNAVAYAELH
ncbi:MAG: diguanylate cyclase [Faecalibacterium sp.]